MKKFYFIMAAMVSVALTSCMNDEFVGDSPGTGTSEKEQAISFGSGFQALTRGDLTGDQAASKLNHEFKVYGVKSNRTTATNYDNVFPNFIVRYSTTQSNNAEYNDGWYYVGAAGSQTIRYWDYASADYHFVAGSPVANFTYATDGTTGDIKTATVTGLGGRLNRSHTVAKDAAAVYIADPVVMTKPTGGAKYGEVKFTFRSMQSKVRVGIYETIPGYKITEIKFYQSASAATPDNGKYITLYSTADNYFQGGSDVEGTVTYNWTTPGYTFAYSTEPDKKPTLGNYWEGGQFTSGVPANTSAATNLYGISDSSKGTDGYYIVMPTPSTTTTATPLTLKCDYVLKSLDDVDEIHVTGATATIPATYTKWAPNTAYTYLFKISDNTNGSSGTPGTDPAGLYPITFDAVVVNVADATQNVGTETTLSTPSISVYQDGDVVENGITFKTGAITVKAYEGATEVTPTWSYITIPGTTYDYSKDYEHLGASGTATIWTSGALTSVTASNTYVIKAVTSNGTAYFVLVVGSAETGPTNP